MSERRILIVDDNAMNTELVSFMLLGAGLSVRAAPDAEAALGLINEFAPELILMDIQMPGMDGLALTQLIKQNPATQHIVVIAFTAYAMKGDEGRMLAAGCDGYLAKPIDVSSFVSRVQSWLPPRRL